MNLRVKTASVLGAAAIAATSLVALPGTAHAAYPTCNSVKQVKTVYQPYYTGTGSRNCVMGIGAPRSSAVTQLQLVLNSCYQQDVTIDSVYGPRTSGAVKYVQQVEGVPADGVYGPQTRRAMAWRAAGGGCVKARV